MNVLTPYISIDIETTGLDPELDHVLEFAAVLWTDHRDVSALPIFHSIISPRPEGRISGSFYALKLNSALIEKIMDGKGIPLDSAMNNFKHFLRYHGFSETNKAIALGKNFGSFDLKFLEKSPLWPQHLFSHRSLDVGSLYASSKGVPSLSAIYDQGLCKKPLVEGEYHTALYDARITLHAARERLNG